MRWRATCWAVTVAGTVGACYATSKGSYDVVSALAPLPMLTGWMALRGPAERFTGWAVLLTAVYLTVGTAHGTLREETASNRVTHAVMAALLAWALWQEIRTLRLPWERHRLLLGLIVFSFAFSLGSLMEVAQAAMAWTPVDGGARWRDTIGDLVADAVGASMIAVVASLRARRESGSEVASSQSADVTAT